MSRSREVVMDDDAGMSAPSAPSAGQGRRAGVHYLAKCVLKGSAVIQAVSGHFRSPSSLEIALGKETAIELVDINEDGIMQSVCEQTTFGKIKDLSVLHWDESKRAISQGKDLLIALSDSGMLTFLMFFTEMDRFAPLTHIQLPNPGNLRHQLGNMLAIESNGCYVAVSAYEDQFALLSISTSVSGDITGKILKIFPCHNFRKSIIRLN